MSVTFGLLLRRFRLAASLSQEALAERANLSASAIASLESGRRTSPRLETVALLVVALGLDHADRSALLAAATGTPVPDPAAPAVEATQAGHAAQPAPLPLPPTALMGREHEQAAIRRLLQQADEPGGARLLTLIGPGGVGKTRLALAVAAASRESYTNGAVFVDLSALRDPDLVPSTIALALGVREAGGQSLRDALVAHMRERSLLLVLDNAEQVVEAAPLVAYLVVTCPRLVVVVTSRSALHVRGEQRFWVPPLATPLTGRLVTHQDLAGYAAVQLFVARAQAVQPEFQLDAANIEMVAQICARLDGLPLAIELAAARVLLLPPRALLARLNTVSARLGVLSGGPRDLPVRQQTLRAALAWSYDLLTPEHQGLMRRLAVFVAGFTLDAAEQIAPAASPLEGSDAHGGDVLEGLAALADASLLRPEEGAADEPRFGMLEIIREYGLERLAESGETATLRRRHAAYYQALAERAEPALTGAEQPPWLARLERDHDNLRAALQWARETGDVADGLRLAGALWRFWYTHGHLSEGRRWLEWFLVAPRDGAVHDAVLAKGLLGAGVLARMQGDYTRATVACQESLTLYRTLDDVQGIAVALNVLGNVAVNQGDHQRAVALSEESLALQRAVGHKRGIAVALNNLGVVVLNQGDYARAEALCQESLTLARELGDHRGSAAALTNLGDAARDQGSYQRAASLYAEGLPLYRSTGDNENLAICLEGVAAVAGALGQWEGAARLCGAAAALRHAIDAPLPADSRAFFERTLAGARAALGTATFEVAWGAGQGLSLEQAIAEALALSLSVRPVSVR